MSQTTYQVDYIVNVINGEALSQLNAMRTMMNKLGKSVQILDRLNSRVTKLNKTLCNKSWKVNLSTTDAERKLTNLEAHLDRIRGKVTGMGMAGAGATTGAGRTTGRTTTSSTRGGSTATSSANASRGGIIPYNGSRTLVQQSRGGGYSRPYNGSYYPSYPQGGAVGYPYYPYSGSGSRPRYNSRQLRGGRVPQNTRGIPHQYWWSHVGSGNTVIDVPYTDVSTGATVPAARGIRGGSRGAYPVGPYMGGTGGGGGRGGNRGRGGGNRNRGNRGRGGGGSRRGVRPNNLTYKLFGPTPLTNNGGMAIDMLKGMGIAYGIAGIGSMMGNIISESANYDNTMTIVENILKSHDDSPDFSGKFGRMSSVIRQVGKQTKYKVTEVADAAKFLAMAGLKVDDISRAIKPISNIALVGDTDLGETADLVTNIMTAYNMQSHQMNRAADVMTNTFTMTNTTLPEIAEAFKYSGSLLSAGGINFAESTAAIGILGDAGIKGSQAGTTMRTILNNIINPRGKYRKAEWAKTGIKTTDEYGQIRSLADIFTELSQKNLPVETFYKLFDKTAAAGAVALAGHVEKWNRVIEENFMSQGIADKNAEAMKNTVQGLWAQLQSSFYDNGLLAFKNVEGEIKNILRNITAWLQSKSGQDTVDHMFKSFMDFADIIKTVSQEFFGFYNMFGGAIKNMILWQLRLWPYIKLFTTLKTAFLALTGIIRVAAGVRALTLAMRGLYAVVGAKGAGKIIWSQIGSYIATGNTAQLLPWLSGNVVANGKKGAPKMTGKPGSIVVDKNTGIPYVVGTPGSSSSKEKRGKNRNRGKNKSNNIIPTPKTPSSTPNPKSRFGANMSKWGKVGKYALGAAAVGGGIAAMSSDSGWGGTLAGVATTGLGIWGMTGFAGAGALFTNPVGWGILALAAVGGVTAAILSNAAATKRAQKAADEWKSNLDKIHLSNIDLTADNGMIIANMRVYNNTLLDQKQRIQGCIDVLNEYQRLRTLGDSDKSEGAIATTPNGNTFKWAAEIAGNNTGKFSELWPHMQAIGVEAVPNGGGEKYMLNGYELGRSNNRSIQNLNETEASKVALAIRGTEAPIQDVENAYLRSLITAKDVATVNSRFQQIRDTYLPKINSLYNDNLSSEKILSYDEKQARQTEAYQAAFRPRVMAVQDRYQGLINAMTKFDAGTPLGTEEMQDALTPYFGLLFDRKQVGLIGTPQWYASIANIQAHPEKYKGLDGKPLNHEAAQNLVTDTFNWLNDLYGNMNDKWHPMFGDLLNRSIWNKALPAGMELPDGGYAPGAYIGAKAKLGGITYTWKVNEKDGNWGTQGWFDANGNQYFPNALSGNLQLLDKDGHTYSQTAQQLNQILFTSAFASSYPATNALKGVGTNNTFAFNGLYNPYSLTGNSQYTPWSANNYFANWSSNYLASKYPLIFGPQGYLSSYSDTNTGFLFQPVNQSGYKPGAGPLAQNQSTQLKAEFTGPTVKIEHLTIENHGSEMTLGTFNNLLTQSVTQARNTVISLNPTT